MDPYTLSSDLPVRAGDGADVVAYLEGTVA
jgi:hypothetical protein